MSEKKDFPVVLVTGGGCRIGAAIVRCFANHGWRTVIHYRHSRQAAMELLQEIGGEYAGHRLVQLDLLTGDLRGNLLEPVLQSCGRLDCLINNAAVYRRFPMADLTPEILAADYAINFSVPFQLMREFRKAAVQGSVINLLDQRVASVDPSSGAYGLAKKSLRDATEACALEWAPHIRVNAVAPGIVLPPPELKQDLAMNRILQYVPLQQRSSEDEVAGACYFLANAPTITGQILYVDGGLHLQNGNLGEKTAVGKTGK